MHGHFLSGMMQDFFNFFYDENIMSKDASNQLNVKRGHKEQEGKELSPLFTICFLTLLDCVNRVNAVAHGPSSVCPSVVRKRRFLRNHQAQFCGKVPIHHITRHLFRFSNFWESLMLTNIIIFVNMGAYGSEIFKRLYSSYSYDSFSTRLFLNIPCDSPHKTC